MFYLPDKSKQVLRENDIPIPTLTSKPPLFNYPSFVKSISIHVLDKQIKKILRTHQPNIPQDLFYKKYLLILNPIFTMLMNQASLKEMNFYLSEYIPNIRLSSYPGAMNCLKYLLEFSCGSNLPSDFFHQLSQLSHHIQTLNLEFVNEVKNISNGLKDLISVQKNLKYLNIYQPYKCEILDDIVSSLINVSTTLISLKIYGVGNGSLSFLSNFIHLRELALNF